MKKLIILILLLGGGCASVDQYRWGYTAPTPKVKIKLITSVQFENPTEHDGKKWRVCVQFAYNGEYTHIVQEILLGNGLTIVESFRVNNGMTCTDVHSYRKHDYRRMYVYAANVIGANENASGFAMLACNKTGYIQTTTGPSFNKLYRENFEIAGVITDDARQDGFTWCVVCAPELDVIIPVEARVD